MWPEWRVALFLLLSLAPWSVLAQGSQTLWTSFVPLAVRSPYLSAWMNTSNIPFNTTNPSDRNTLRSPSVWPVFYRDSSILGWAGLIRIDNETFKWLGDPANPGGSNRSVLTNIQLTPTRTIMNMTAGPIDFQVTWLSPIEPSDPVAQSLPFTYMSLQARSNDGQNHNVQVYSDISAEWSSGDRTQLANWDMVATDTVVFHEQFLQNQQVLSEIRDQALDSNTYYGMQLGNGVTYMIDTDINSRNLFGSSGVLNNMGAPGSSPINKPFHVYAIAKDLGSVGASFTSPVVWAVGMLRNPAIAYTAPNGTVENMYPYWTSQYKTPHDAVTAALEDSNGAFTRAVKLDASILQKAANISTNYADIVSLAARQAIAGTELTISQNNVSDVKMFMKDIGSSSVTSRVSPVEVLYASFPSFLFMNASYGGWLLEPLLEFSESSRWTYDYAPQDLGTSYPNATGNTSPHMECVEQTGNMLIMTLAHARASGDGSLLAKYYDLLKKWGDYLVQNTLPVPQDQHNADQLTRANSTNLAIKGIIGIQALSQISQILDKTTDVQHYASVASGYASTWASLAMPSSPTTPQHILSNYGANTSSWALAYNLFADKWLGTNIVSDLMYSHEEAFLETLIASNPNGIPIEDDLQSQQPGDTAWTLFTAATVSNVSVRDGLITPIWNHISQNHSHTIFPTKFKTDVTGDAFNNLASPGVGGVFAPLALNAPALPVPNPASTTQKTSKKSNVGPIVGGVIGGLIGLGLLIFLAIFCWRRTREEPGDNIEKAAIAPDDLVPQAFPYGNPSEHPTERARPVLDDRSPQEPDTLSPLRYYPPAKDRRAATPGPSRQTPSTSSSSAYTSSSHGNSSREPPSTAPSSRSGTTTSPISPQEVQGLRVEVENLRRVMQSFQQNSFDPPPEYVGS